MLNKMLFNYIAFIFVILSKGVSFNFAFYINDDARFSKHISTAQRIQSHGYPAELHHVETPDNYVIGLFRLPYSHHLQNEKETRPAVLLLHGLFSCSDAYILTGPADALAYNLADAGFDVWLGNARGNYYSRNNTKRSINHPYFWRFSWHEIGYYDVPAMIDYILKQTQQKALHYIGHSQGTTSFMVAMSTQPAYNAKIKTAHLLAPVAYMAHVTDPLLTRLSKSLGRPGIVSALFGTQEFLPHNQLFMQLGYSMCGANSPDLGLCSTAAVILEGYAPNANSSIFPMLAETHPAGASTDQILHYMQSIRNGHFRHFDHGAQKNMELYKQSTPPDYELFKITSEVFLYYGDRDGLAVVEDVLKLAAELPNVKRSLHVPDPTWSHADFTWATSAPTQINLPIIEAMQEYEAQNVH